MPKTHRTKVHSIIEEPSVLLNKQTAAGTLLQFVEVENKANQEENQWKTLN